MAMATSGKVAPTSRTHRDALLTRVLTVWMVRCHAGPGSKIGSPTKHPRQLGEALRQFERTVSDLWLMMTQVNAELMFQQAVGCGRDDKTAGLSGAVRSQGITAAHSQGSAHEDVKEAFLKAAASLNVASDAEREVQGSLSQLHMQLDEVFKSEVGGCQDAVVALEKSRERLDLAKAHAEAAARRGGSETSKKDIQVRVARDVYERHAAVVSDILPRAGVKVRAVLAGGVAQYMRARAKSAKACNDEFERLEFGLLPLDAAAAEGGAMSSQMKLQTRRRQPAFMSPLLKTIVSTSFIAASAVAQVASGLADNDEAARDVLPSLVRLLDDLDLCFPLFKGLVQQHVKACSALHDAPATLFHDHDGARGIVTSCLELASRDKFFPCTFQAVLESICTSYADFAERGGSLSASRDASTRAEVAQLYSAAVRSFCEAAFRSVRDYPSFMRLCCRHVYDTFAECGRREQRQAAGSVVVLCFLCPALLSPGDYGATRLKGVSRRLLLLVCQAVEMLVLGERDSGGDESLGERTRQLLAEVRPSYHRFLDAVGESGGEASNLDGGIQAGGDSQGPDEDLDAVADFTRANWEAVHRCLASGGYLAEAQQLEAGLKTRGKSGALPRQPRQRRPKPQVKARRVCTMPGLTSLKAKGRILGIKYRNMRSDEEEDDAVGFSLSDDDYSMPPTALPAPTSSTSTSRLPLRTPYHEGCVGVGITFDQDPNGYLRVASLADGGPAERCGMIEVGDLVVQVDAQNVYVHDNPLQVVSPQRHTMMLS